MRNKNIVRIANGKWETFIKLKRSKMLPVLQRGELFLDTHTKKLYAGLGDGRVITYEGVSTSFIGPKGEISTVNFGEG